MAAFIIAFAYPISGRIHQQIRLAISERQAGHIVTDPLNPERVIS
jgi:hypothetical protein